MKYNKKTHEVCFSLEELHTLFRNHEVKQMLHEIEKAGINLSNITKDEQAMKEFSDLLLEKLNKRKEEIEIFSVLFEKGSDICFPATRRYRPEHDVIQTFQDLLKVWEECSDVDFSILSSDGIRQFQMKRFLEIASTESLHGFIIEKISEYGGALGKTNLLIFLSAGGDLSKCSFGDLNELLLSEIKDFSFDGEILVAYNENNENDVVVSVYPDLGVSRHKVFVKEYLEMID